jgi:CubicO group peptidase (beta-lactamase class C family)
MKRIFRLSFLLLFSVEMHAQPSAYQIKEMDIELQGLYRKGKFNGAVLIAQNGSPIYKKVFGVANAKTNEALKFNSSFNLASVSKQLQLKETGKLDYDDKLTQYFPEFPSKKSPFVTCSTILLDCRSISTWRNSI